MIWRLLGDQTKGRPTGSSGLASVHWRFFGLGRSKSFLCGLTGALESRSADLR